MDPVTLTHSSMPNPEDPALPQLGLESPKRGQPIAAGGAHPLRHISPSERPWLGVGCGFYQVCWAWPPRTQERPLCGVRTILCSGEEKLIERQGARLGKTLKQWREAFLAYFDPGRANNLGTEAINGLIELHRRVARGFRNRERYRLRMLLIGGGLSHPHLS